MIQVACDLPVWASWQTVNWQVRTNMTRSGYLVIVWLIFVVLKCSVLFFFCANFEKSHSLLESSVKGKLKSCIDFWKHTILSIGTSDDIISILENGYVMPPVYLLPMALNIFLFCKAVGTIVAPYWSSSPFFPLLFAEGCFFSVHCRCFVF